MKKCKICEVEKSFEEFYKRGENKLFNCCKICHNDRVIKNRNKNPEKYKEYTKEYKTKNKELLREKRAKYKFENKHKIKESSASYYLKNKNIIAERNKKWKIDNPEKLKTQRENYKPRERELKQINIEHIRKRSNIYTRNKRKTDLNFKIKCNLRSRFTSLVKGYKYTSSIDILGCTIDQFKIHIESKFLPGMTWENHGFHGWHYEHIRPCCSFDFSDPDQQKQCFHWSNFRPLWSIENWSKGGKWESDQN